MYNLSRMHNSAGQPRTPAVTMNGVALGGTRVLVTGGAGTIGSTIVDQLLERDVAEVVVLDNLVRGRRDNLKAALATGRVELVEGDIRDRALLARLMAGTDVVFHQAAIRITQCAEEPRAALEVMVDGTFDVLEAAVEAGVRKVVAASSASVYGLADTFPTGEDHHPWHNRTFYGAAKAFNEGMLRSFAEMYGLRYVALRYFNVYGPRMDIHGVYTEVLVRWIERIAAGNAPLILGDGKQTMDFVYVDDVARSEHPGRRGGRHGPVLQRGQRCRGEHQRPGGRTPEGDGVRPGSRVRPRAIGQRRPPPPRRDCSCRRAARLRRPGGPSRRPGAPGRVVATVVPRALSDPDPAHKLTPVGTLPTPH